MFVCCGPGDNLNSSACFKCQDSATEINWIYPKADGESSALQTSRRRSGLPFAPSNNQNVATHKKLFESIKLASMLPCCSRTCLKGHFGMEHFSPFTKATVGELHTECTFEFSCFWVIAIAWKRWSQEMFHDLILHMLGINEATWGHTFNHLKSHVNHWQYSTPCNLSMTPGHDLRRNKD